ncbi:MAG: hypothetical protein ACFFCW_34790 [Candidatus Hodarchaeota archaeon]
MTKEPIRGDVEDSKIYEMLSTLMMYSEQVRWTRFNNLLVVNSILIVAWAAIFAGTSPFSYKALLLSLLCLPGVIFGILWSFLGRRSSKYLDDFHKMAEKLEKGFPKHKIKPFHKSEETRETVRTGFMKLTSSKWIVTWIPIAFSLLFLGLILASWICDPT